MRTSLRVNMAALPAALLLSTGCPASPNPSSTGTSTPPPPPTTTATSRATTTATASATATSASSTKIASSATSLAPCATTSAAPRPPDDSLENPWCAPLTNRQYGSWTPKPEEVLSAIKGLKGGDSWLRGMLDDCIQRIGHPYVAVMSGVMSGDRGTPNAILVGIGSVEWNGRRFITVSNDARMGGAFVFTMDAVELTAGGPVQVIETCQDDPLSTAGPSGKRVPPLKGWSIFPEDVRKQLCP